MRSVTQDPAATTAMAAGPRQFGRYRILKELGRGAMGVVHLAEDPALGRRLAIKTITLPADARERAEYEARFMQEARAAGGLNHPNIITIHDIGRENDQAYMAMECLEGVELGHLMAQRRLPLPIMLDIGAQIAEGLAFAHQAGVIHRDIKPANIMLVRGSQVKIMDFGIARVRQSELKTQTGLMLGSPRYMSPEQVSGTPIDHRSDIFTLGVLLYEMATGMAPFTGADFIQLIYNIASEPAKPVNRVMPGLPDRLAQIVDRAMAKEPAGRYQDAAQLATDLRALKAQVESMETTGSRTRMQAMPRPDPVPTVKVQRAPVAARMPLGVPIGEHFELPHEREWRLAQEAQVQAEFEEPIPETGWRWTARYAVGIVVAMTLGCLLGEFALFERTHIGSHDLSVAELARFLGFGSALLLAGYVGIKSAAVLNNIGKGRERFAALLPPLTGLLVSFFGYRVGLIVAAPLLSGRARTQFDWIFVLAIGGCALWLAYTVFRQSDRLHELLKRKVPASPKSKSCPACGTTEAGNGKYCAQCGAVRDAMAKTSPNATTTRRRDAQTSRHRKTRR